MKLSNTLLGLLIGAGLALPAFAAKDTLPAKMARPGGFPERPLTMIVPYGSAGGSAQVSQAMADAVTKLTGVGINRDHKPGGSGVVGLKAYMAALPDGYTILQHIDDATSAHALDPKQPNPAKDLIPLVTSQITFSQIYIRKNETRFKDWKGFVNFARKQNGKATIANVSKEGSMERLNMRFITSHYKIKIQQVSFDKPAPRYGALKGGQVDALFEQPGDVRQFLESGDFKPILTLLHERPAAFAKVPSLKDEGMAFKPLMRYRGFYVHKDAPAERVKWLQWAFQKSFFSPEYQAFNKKKYMDLIDSFRDTQGTRELIEETIGGYRATYKEMGLIK
jgi:tripartite-type tricarboxylate transporter receptor subunit TctC